MKSVIEETIERAKKQGYPAHYDGDLYCNVCGEPWNGYGVLHGDMTQEESIKFIDGLGCPSCTLKKERSSDRMKKQEPCAQRIGEHLQGRLEDIKDILKAEDQIEALNELALCYEDDPHYRAKKLELSTGGPADGFRFFENEDRIEYYFQDWFDGATEELEGEEYKLLSKLYETCLNF